MIFEVGMGQEGRLVGQPLREIRRSTVDMCH